MFLKNLKLTNFRNYPSLELNFSQTTLLIGRNAQGKSNLLESIYFLSTTKSPKAEKDSQLIKQGQDFCRLEGLVERDREEKTNLEIVMQIQQAQLFKRTKVNGVPRRVTDYMGNLVTVLFSPEDILLVIGSPSLRRWHVDITLAQVDKSYKKAISEYSEAIASRNKVLKRIKEGTSRIDELDFWSDRAIESGQIISKKRRDFFEFINTVEKRFGEFSYLYKSSEIDKERLREYLPREIASTNSLIGPHRDDFIFRLNGLDLAYFGSRGEQRTAVLDLKLSEVAFITKSQNSKPLLLLDDIFSELDTDHREHVISVVSNQQTIISAVENEVIPNKFLKSVQLIKIEEGVATF